MMSVCRCLDSAPLRVALSPVWLQHSDHGLAWDCSHNCCAVAPEHSSWLVWTIGAGVNVPAWCDLHMCSRAVTRSVIARLQPLSPRLTPHGFCLASVRRAHVHCSSSPSSDFPSRRHLQTLHAAHCLAASTHIVAVSLHGHTHGQTPPSSPASSCL